MTDRDRVEFIQFAEIHKPKITQNKNYSQIVLPKIRFFEFKDNWLYNNLCDICKFSKGKDVKNKIFSDTGHKYIGYGDLYTKYTTVTYNTITKISDGDFNNQIYSTGNEILIPSSGESIYEMNTCTVLLEEGVLIGSDINILSPYTYNAIFIGYLIRNKTKDISRLAQGHSVVHLYNKELSALKLAFPTLPEQQKIADFLTTYDKLITLQEEKITNLKLYKKGLLQKLFLLDNNIKLQLRFNDFTDNWTSVKLGDIVDSYSGGTPSVSNFSYYTGTIPFIRSAEINAATTELNITNEGLNNSSSKLVQVGDILYALYGATSGEVAMSKINGAINQAILAIKPKCGYNSFFIMQWLRYNKEKITDVYLQGGQGNLSAQIIKNLSIILPSFEEQQKIANFLTTLDTQIEHQENLLRLYKQQKKGFLQKMFV